MAKTKQKATSISILGGFWVGGGLDTAMKKRGDAVS